MPVILKLVQPYSKSVSSLMQKSRSPWRHQVICPRTTLAGYLVILIFLTWSYLTDMCIPFIESTRYVTTPTPPPPNDSWEIMDSCQFVNIFQINEFA